jgi:hypothetical protein
MRKKDFTPIERLAWDECVQAKSWEQYISEYTGHKMDHKKYFDIATVVLAVLSSVSWGGWKVFNNNWFDYATLIFILLTAVSQLISAIGNKVVITDDALKSLSRLRTLYIGYYNQFEDLMESIVNKSISQKEIKDRFFQLRESVYPIEELKDSINIKEIKKVSEKALRQTSEALKERWNITD